MADATAASTSPPRAAAATALPPAPDGRAALGTAPHVLLFVNSELQNEAAIERQRAILEVLRDVGLVPMDRVVCVDLGQQPEVLPALVERFRHEDDWPVLRLGRDEYVSSVAAISAAVRAGRLAHLAAATAEVDLATTTGVRQAAADSDEDSDEALLAKARAALLQRPTSPDAALLASQGSADDERDSSLPLGASTLPPPPREPSSLSLSLPPPAAFAATSPPRAAVSTALAMRNSARQYLPAWLTGLDWMALGRVLDGAWSAVVYLQLLVVRHPKPRLPHAPRQQGVGPDVDETRHNRFEDVYAVRRVNRWGQSQSREFRFREDSFQRIDRPAAAGEMPVVRETFLYTSLLRAVVPSSPVSSSPSSSSPSSSASSRWNLVLEFALGTHEPQYLQVDPEELDHLLATLRRRCNALGISPNIER